MIVKRVNMFRVVVFRDKEGKLLRVFATRKKMWAKKVIENAWYDEAATITLSEYMSIKEALQIRNDLLAKEIPKFSYKEFSVFGEHRRDNLELLQELALGAHEEVS